MSSLTRTCVTSVQSYAPTFYVQQGLGAMSFTYAMIGQAIGVVGCAFGIVLFDITGRRPLMIYASTVCAFLLYLGSGLGTIGNPNTNETNTLVACFILLPAFTRISASNNAFLTGAEIGGVRMRKKIMVSAARDFDPAVQAVLMDTGFRDRDGRCSGLPRHVRYAVHPAFPRIKHWLDLWLCRRFLCDMGMVLFPGAQGKPLAQSLRELCRILTSAQGRTLEEIDDLFAAKLPAWRFKGYETHGTVRMLADLEKEKDLSAKQEIAREIEVQKAD